MSPLLAALAAQTTVELRYHRSMRPAELVGTLKNGESIFRIHTCNGEQTYYVKRAAKSPTAKGYTRATEITYKDMAAATFMDGNALKYAVGCLRQGAKNSLDRITYYDREEEKALAELARYREGFTQDIDGVLYATNTPTGVEGTAEGRIGASFPVGFTAKSVGVVLPETKTYITVEYRTVFNPEHPWQKSSSWGGRQDCTQSGRFIQPGHYDERREAHRRIAAKLEEMADALEARHA